MAKRKNNHQEEEGFSLHPEVVKAIWLVVTFASALLFFLSLIGYAGQVGAYINKYGRILFGVGVWMVPVLLIASAVFLLNSKERKYQIIKITATIVFLLVVCALLNLQLPQSSIFFYLNRGIGGGYAGLVLSYPLLAAAGFFASLIILTALGTIALLLMFENKLFRIGQAIFWITSKLGITTTVSRMGGKIKKKLTKEPEFIEDIKEPKKGEQDQLLFDKSGALKEKPRVSETPPAPEAFHKKRVDEPSSEELTTSLKSRYRRKIDIPLSLLDKRGDIPSSGDVAANKEKIKKALENFGIAVEMRDTSTGPTVTQYTLKPQEGVKLAQITALSNDLALALAAHPIRLEAPIPGKSLVGIEVPNSVIATVGLREVLQSEKFRSERKSSLTLGLGKDVSGDPYTADLESMPHLLIAGATGSGKSVCINAIILSLLYQNSPDELKCILIDPKRVELTVYNEIPHLLTPVITDAKKTINALKWCVAEMDRRYRVLEEAGKRNIAGYNRVAEEIMPYIIIVIDELADLMSVAAKEVEALIVRLAQMARAVGIHLVLATQRPSVNVLTGLIKANITARIAFSVASQTDSRTILDSGGAEKLLGRGDMLFITAELAKPKRLQGAFVDEREIKRVVRFLRDAAEPDYLEEVTEKAVSWQGGNSFKTVSGEGGFGEFDGEGDSLLDEAMDLIIRARKASASYLQRHLRIGYARAARILDLLEAEGVIGPGDGAKARDVLVGRGDGDEEGADGEEKI